MRHHRILTAWLAAAAAGILLPAALVGAQTGLTVTGDQAAWREDGAAYRKLQMLSGYRVKVSSATTGDMVFEIVPPRSARMTVPAGNGSMETITVNGQSRFRINAPGAPGQWQCQGAPSVQLPGDPTNTIRGTVDVSRGPDSVVAGSPVRSYVYVGTASAQGQWLMPKTTVYIGVQSGLPRRAVTAGQSGEVTVDFYDYGAKISIPLPFCPGG